MKKFLRFWKNESGATAIEYALIAAGVAVAVSAAVFTVGTDVKTSLTEINGALNPE